MAQLKCRHCGFVNPAQKLSCQKCGTPLPKVSIGAAPVPSKGVDQFRRGQIIASRYTVLDMIGRGGMACIYKVQDNTLKEAVALKTMLPEFTKEKALVDRFYNEAKIARQLTHPNIVRVHDIGMADGVMYISMELLNGRSLRGVLDGLQPGQRLPVKTALRIIDQLCAALDYAHEFTIHRDIKPENVMVLNDGTVKLMDFGISKLRADSSLTATSMVMGTPHYMSPEQLKDSRNVDARTDVYSMGVLLYEVMTGNIPTGVPKPASQIMKETPPDIDRIIGTCMEPDPISRYQSIKELRTAVRAILDLVESNTTAQPLDGRKPKPKVKSSGVPKSAVGVAAILLIAAATGAAVLQLDGRRQALLAAEATETPAVAAFDPVRAEFDTLMDWANRAEPLAIEAVGEDELGLSLLEIARNQRTAAQSTGLVEDGRKALACFIGLIACPDHALFVPPGVAMLNAREYNAGPFFIAKDSVTNAEYNQFVQGVDGGWDTFIPEGGPEDSAKGMTFYDAQMYAAYNNRRLPTYAEWVLAFQYYPAELSSDVADWTQTLADGAPNAVLSDELDRLRFGAQVMTVGVDPNDEATYQAYPLAYEGADLTLGIRCVWPVPLDRDFVERALSGLQVNY